MGYGEDNTKQQSVGFKGLERFDITVRVIETIDLMGDLFTSIRFNGINRESSEIWEQFINTFFKVFHITAGMLSKNDLPLITHVEESFSGILVLTPDTASKFLALFEEYLAAMNKAGIYDPAIIRNFYNPATAWERSV